MDAGGLIAELKRRRVFRALVGWSILAFAILQIIEPILHALHWPDSVLTWAVGLLALGFPISAALAWVYDLTSRGIRRTPAPERAHPAAHAVMVSRRTATVLGAAALAAFAFAAWKLHRQSRVRWARDEAIPQVASLLEQRKFAAAVALAEKVKRVDPEEPALLKLWPRLVHVYSVASDPPGADVSVRDYAAAGAPWTALGKTPLDGVPLPRGLYRWRLIKNGFEPLEVAPTSAQGVPMAEGPQKPALLRFKLDAKGAAPAGMVRVAGGKITSDGDPPGEGEPSLAIDDFYIDRFEVTNRQFKPFVDGGGYQKPELWKHAFIQEGRSLPFAEAMGLLRDRTGRPGPAGWISGDFPEGEGDLPVTGVSWHEAAAYAAWAGKSLPTVAQWRHASAAAAFSAAPLIQSSNFSAVRLAPVGSSGGLGAFGTYDMFGNAKEWCWNAVGDKRSLLGGAFDEPAYMAISLDARPPLDRAAHNGFRLARHPESGLPAPLLAPVVQSRWPDLGNWNPPSDELFQAYKSLYAYDHSELSPVVEAVDDSDSRWRKERVSIKAAYGDERLSLFVFLPKNARPPFQTVIHFPGSWALELRSSEELDGLELLLFLVKSGRAVVYPVYKSTYERGDGLTDDTSTRLYRDHVILWMKDVKRAIDWVQTRPDLDHDKLAYYGRSWGAVLWPIAATVETRIKVGVLVSGGLPRDRRLPEVDPPNFAARVRQPTLMVNGRLDWS